MKINTILIGLTAAALAASGCSTPAPELKVSEQQVVELGDEVSLKPESFLLEIPDEETLSEIEVTSPLKDSDKYTWNGFRETVSDIDKDYLGVGTYEVTLNLHGRQYVSHVVVRDTTMPEFISPAAVVTIPQGTENFDFSSIYRTDDKGTVTLHIEGDYDMQTAGTYPVTLIAEDDSGNTNSVEITINVISGNQVISPSDQFDNETPYSPHDKNKDKDKENNSSSSDDSNGSDQSRQPSDDQQQPEEQPDDSQQTSPTACDTPDAPAGAELYSSFEEMYQAGTAWNQSNPDGYFYYVILRDSCGNDVYALTKGTRQADEGVQ